MQILKRQIILAHELSRELRILSSFFNVYMQILDQNCEASHEVFFSGLRAADFNSILSPLLSLLDVEDTSFGSGCHTFPQIQQIIMGLLGEILKFLPPRSVTTSIQIPRRWC